VKKIFLLLALFISVVGVFFSCKKERSCEGCRETNKPPIAIAGPDQVITLRTDSISLDGSASNDPDGTISEWLWKKISGPASFNIINAVASKTVVRTLDTGVYKFELMIKDNGGLSAKDTVQITVNSTAAVNRPPVANAGPDQIINLPTNTVNVNGSASTDPDNNITGYVWTKISGPSCSISNANAVQTQVTNLIEGVYKFELKVTDAGGLSSKDTVQVNILLISSSCEPLNRPVITAQLIPIGNLSIARNLIATVAAGNKIFFAGGRNSTGHVSRVDIYDISSQSWSTAELSSARIHIKAIACGNKVFFAGGDGEGDENSSRIDIYDLTTQLWSTAELPFALPSPHSNNLLVVASVGNKVLFAQPLFATSVLVAIYDVSSQSWSTTTLSEPRVYFNALTAGDKVYFSGGGWDDMPASGTIDIYDNSTGTWSTSLLAEPKVSHGSVYKNGKIYWAGGAKYGVGRSVDSLTCKVEIKDINTQTSTFSNLSQPRTVNSSAFDINGKLAFFGGLNNFDIYDVSTNSWAIGVANQVPSYYIGSSYVSANNAIFFGGGSNSCPSWISCQYYSQVWKLVF
jgi:hypothetical protein